MKTKAKAIVMAMLTLLLVTVISAIPFPVTVSAWAGEIKIGIFGPHNYVQGKGMWEGAEMAKDWVNDNGGIHNYEVKIVKGMEYIDPDIPEDSAAEMTRLCYTEEVDVVYGGFRSECTYAAREVAMDAHVLYFICGAATDELVYDTTPSAGWANLADDYARYKYVFRLTPINVTALVYSLAYFYQSLLGYTLNPLFGGTTVPGQVSVAVLTEKAAWADGLHNMFSVWYPGVWTYDTVLGPYANVTYKSRPSPYETNFAPIMTEVIDSEARLLIQIFSSEAGFPMIMKYREMGVEAVPVGIDVLGQDSTYWFDTGGSCEYEAFLATLGSRSPINTESTWVTGTPLIATTDYWDDYVDAYAHDPIYTSFGPHDGIITLKEIIEANLDADEMKYIDRSGPEFSQEVYDQLIQMFEENVRTTGLVGKFKFTGPHPYVRKTAEEPHGIGVFKYYDADASGTVSEDDQRLENVTVGPGYPISSYVDVGDADEGEYFQTQSPLGQYLDKDASGNVTVGDSRLTNVTYTPSTNGTYTYRDNDASGNVTVCDTRLEEVTAYGEVYTAHTHVEEGDLDIGEALTPLAPVTKEKCTDVVWCDGDIGDPLAYKGLPGTCHDVFCVEYGATWTSGYVRANIVQWQDVGGDGLREIFWPMDQPYSKKFQIPPWMYSLSKTDTRGDYPYYGPGQLYHRIPNGHVWLEDMTAATDAWLSAAGDPEWAYAFNGMDSDMDANDYINIADISRLAKDWDKEIDGGLPIADPPGDLVIIP